MFSGGNCRPVPHFHRRGSSRHTPCAVAPTAHRVCRLLPRTPRDYCSPVLRVTNEVEKPLVWPENLHDSLILARPPQAKRQQHSLMIYYRLPSRRSTKSTTTRPCLKSGIRPNFWNLPPTRSCGHFCCVG